MRRGALNHMEHKSVFCPILLKEMLTALKQRKIEIHRHLKFFIRGKETTTTAKNLFTLKSKENPSIQFELRTYE